MSHSTPPAPRSRRPSLRTPASSSYSPTAIPNVYSDAREHGYQGPTRTVKFQRATSAGGGAIAKSDNGEHCVVAGKLSLRILRLSDSPTSLNPDHHSKIGRGGHRIDAGRNLWTLAGFKVESVTTDVAWGRQNFDHKILTSARNGDLLMWDLNKVGASKYERRARDHLRSINKISLSPVVPYYCLTGSADGDLRIWDVRNFDKSLIRIHHIQPVRTAVFSPSHTNPLQAVVGLDNGSIYRWDLKMGHKGQLDRIPVAHSGPVLSLDWCLGSVTGAPLPPNLSRQESLTGIDTGGSANASGTGWLASGGMDRTVKVWDLNSAGQTTHISQIPTYTLFSSLPVRRALWRPDYECELVVISNAEFGVGTNQDANDAPAVSEKAPVLSSSPEVELGLGAPQAPRPADLGDPVEIWDVRRSYLAKWVIRDSTIDGSVTDAAFRDSHALWTVHSSGAFSQLDVRSSYRPIDAVPRTAASWDANGNLMFVSDRSERYEIPYDDINPINRSSHPDAHILKKALGDTPIRPTRQTLGSVGLESLPEDAEMFEKLARSYIFEGQDKHIICEQNAKAALDIGHVEAAQMWLFAQSLYDAPAPPLPPSTDHESDPPPFALKPFPLPHSQSAPASIPTVSSTDVPTPPPERAVTADNYAPGRSPRDTTFTAPSHASSSSPSPRRPISPVTASPRSVLSNLPSTSSARGSFSFPRRPSTSSILRPRALSTYNKSSKSSLVASGTPSLKHVGEGALDDSDSDPGSSSSDGAENKSVNPMSADPATALSGALHPLTSLSATRALASAPALAGVNPSPLSQNVWTDDSDGDGAAPGDTDSDSSPPRSTDSGSDSGSARRTKRLVAQKSASRTRRRRIAVPQPSPLVKHGSQSSMRTVTAGGEAEDRPASRAAHSVRSQRVISGSSLPAAENLLSPAMGSIKAREEDDSEAQEREARIRKRGWAAVRAGLEGVAESGDVQTAAILALVCAEELELSARRVIRIVESYVDLLNRLRMHAAAAYVRKYASYPDIQEPTQLQTTVYISCGRCEKPLLRPGGYCPSCKLPSMRCSICNLPVRGSAFLCAVCAHGGHLTCYRAYFSVRPPDELERGPSPVRARARSPSRTSTGTLIDDALAETVQPDQMAYARDSAREVELKPLLGRICAAGCGHVCWVSNELVDR